MKIKFITVICVCLVCLIQVDAARFYQTNIQTFWKDFKSAVEKSDKTALAGMTKFPLSMPYGVKSVKTKADFIKRFDKIFNDEADAAKCFAKAKLEKEDAKHYAVYCGFKETPEDTENTPIKYQFELTKTGWKFVGLDNINE